MTYLYLFLIIIALIVLVVLLRKRIKDLESEVGKISEKKEGQTQRVEEINRRRLEEKENKKKKILEVLKEKNQIANSDVEHLFGVSDATATNYLQELEDEGKIEQVGKSGPSVYYRLTIN